MDLAHPYSRTDLFRYFDGLLDPKTSTALEEHLDGCERCQGYLSFLREFRKGLAELTEDDFTSREPCPDPWTLASYEAGDVDAETARHVRAHLLFCDECAEAFSALRRARGPHWTRVILRAVDGLWECVQVVGVGALVGPAAETAVARGEPRTPARTALVEAAVPDPESGTETTVRITVEVDAKRRQAAILLEAKPLPTGWKVRFSDAHGQEIADLPLDAHETEIASGISDGSYILRLSKDKNDLATFDLDVEMS